jgi:hypothetical protein
MKRIDIHPDHMIAKALLQITGVTQQEDAEYTEGARESIVGRGVQGLMEQIRELAGENVLRGVGAIDDYTLTFILHRVSTLLALRMREVSKGRRVQGDTELLIALREIGYPFPDTSLKLKEPK